MYYNPTHIFTIKGAIMDFAEVIKGYISHMNDHHSKELEALLKKFGNVDEPKNVLLESIDLEGLDIAHSGGKLRVEFPQKATQENLRDTIIELCKSIEQSKDLSKVEREIVEFAKSFGSACLATLSPKGEVLCTYAPVIHHKEKFFIYISEVGEHFSSIKSHPQNIELMFLEDESKAKSVILRKRLRYRVEPRFIQRGGKEFDEVYDSFIEQSGGGGGIKTIRDFADFHLIELKPQGGRFVKGFGEAYLIKDGKASHITGGAGGGSPHKFPHKGA